MGSLPAVTLRRMIGLEFRAPWMMFSSGRRMIKSDFGYRRFNLTKISHPSTEAFRQEETVLHRFANSLDMGTLRDMAAKYIWDFLGPTESRQ
jgi:hypothetical protein